MGEPRGSERPLTEEGYMRKLIAHPVVRQRGLGVVVVFVGAVASAWA